MSENIYKDYHLPDSQENLEYILDSEMMERLVATMVSTPGNALELREVLLPRERIGDESVRIEVKYAHVIATAENRLAQLPEIGDDNLKNEVSKYNSQRVDNRFVWHYNLLKSNKFRMALVQEYLGFLRSEHANMINANVPSSVIKEIFRKVALDLFNAQILSRNPELFKFFNEEVRTTLPDPSEKGPPED